MTRTPPFQKICLAVVLIVVCGIGALATPVVAQQDSWPSDTRNNTDGTSQDRNSNWNWYGNGVLVQPSKPAPTGAWQGNRFEGNRPPPPTYYQRDGRTQAWGPYEEPNQPAATPYSPYSYGGLVGKSRPWGELPDGAQQSERSPYPPENRYEMPLPRQDRWRTNQEEPLGVAPSTRHSWRDYMREGERGYPEERRRPRDPEPTEAYRPSYEDRYREPDRYDSGGERGSPWQDGYGGYGRRPLPYAEGGYLP